MFFLYLELQKFLEFQVGGGSCNILSLEGSIHGFGC